jgi:hypothetical protein
MKGLNPVLEHFPAMSGDRGELLGAYNVIHYKDGFRDFEFMTAANLNKRRQSSKSKNSPAWRDWSDEMNKKTVIRNHLKFAPLSVEDNRLLKAAHAENLFVDGKSQSGLFLPDSMNEPITVTGGDPAAQKRISGQFDRIMTDSTFHELFGDLEKDELFDRYIAACMAQNEMTEDEIRSSAVENNEIFREGFKNWKIKQKPTASKAEKSTIPNSEGKGSDPEPNAEPYRTSKALKDFIATFPDNVLQSNGFQEFERMFAENPKLVPIAEQRCNVSRIKKVADLNKFMKLIESLYVEGEEEPPPIENDGPPEG